MRPPTMATMPPVVSTTCSPSMSAWFAAAATMGCCAAGTAEVITDSRKIAGKASASNSTHASRFP